MRWLMAAVVGMGILIVAGVAIIATTLVQRVATPGGGATAATVLLDEPVGTRIAGISLAPDRMAVQLQGGGADRVVLVDTKTGRVVNRTGLSR